MIATPWGICWRRMTNDRRAENREPRVALPPAARTERKDPPLVAYRHPPRGVRAGCPAVFRSPRPMQATVTVAFCTAARGAGLRGLL
jgi:hypothetical protein